MFHETTTSVASLCSSDLGRGRRRGNGALRLGLLLGLFLGSVGCGSSDVWVYVDNAADKPMVVTVDGKEEATVEPGDFETLKCQPGERRIHVQCGDKILFDDTKDLQKSDTLGASRRYLFNPD